MRRLDRYFLSVFIPACVAAVGTLVVLFVIIDIMSKRRDFTRLATVNVLQFTTEYYLLRLPLMIYTVLPMVPLLAGAFTVIKMARSNEIVPVIAGGMSLRRLIAPVAIVAVLACGGIVAIEEAVMPPLATRLAETEAILAERERSSYVIESDEEGNYFYAAEYDHVRFRMELFVEWLAIGPGGGVLARAEGRLAEWDEERGGWTLFDGRVIEYEDGRVRTHAAPDGSQVVATREIPAEGLFVRSSLRGYDIRAGGEMLNRFVTWGQSMRELRDRPEVPFHWVRVLVKAVFPLAPVILLAAGLPMVMGPEEKSFLRGITIAFLFGVLYVAATIAGQDVANKGLVSPWAGVVGPTVLFGILGLVNVVRMRT